MQIKEGNIYRIKGNSSYLKNKYGSPNPEIYIEDTFPAMNNGRDETILEMAQSGHPACALYYQRAIAEGLPDPKDSSNDKDVYYGKIEYHGGFRLGELVHESELEELT